MFFEFPARKVVFLGILAGILIATVSLSLATIAANTEHFVELGYAADRVGSALSYEFSFKLPSEAGVALAAAGGVPQGVSGAPVATTTAASIPVLLYHGENGGPSMTTATFVAQLDALHRAGWRTVTLPQFEAFMQGKLTLPDKSFLLTFDDGRRDTFYTADPVLQDLGYTAVMFVITGLSLPNNGPHAVNDFYLSKPELAYMAASGRWELESHGNADHAGYAVPTATSTAASLTLIPSQHFLSNHFWNTDTNAFETPAAYEARITGDLAHAKALLETDFGAPVNAYAYPFNDFGEDSVNDPGGATAAIAQAVAASYRYSFYQTWAGNGDSFNYPDPSAHLVKRIEPLASWSGADLLAVLDGGRAKPLPYAATSFGADWLANWGTLTHGTSLTLTATASTTGAAAFLDGTEAWTNYRIQAVADAGTGTFSLIARHTETAAPYLVCAFSNDRIYLERHEGSSQTTLASRPYVPSLRARTFAMTVTGPYASCSSGGVVVAATDASISTEGGVGASVWDPEAGTAQATLSAFTVSPR